MSDCGQSAAGPRPPLYIEDEGCGAPLLLIHGLLTDLRMWEAVARSLTREFRVIRCDLPGHGRSPRPAPGARRHHMEHILALLDWLGLPAAHLAAYGSGCSVAAAVAARAPGRVLSLTAVDPVVPRVDTNAAVQESWHLETLLQWLTVGHGLEVRKPEHVAAVQQVVRQQTHGFMGKDQTAVALPAGVDLAGLAAVTCPMLTLVGEQTSNEVKAVVATVFGQAAHCDISLVPGATRRSPVEAPYAVASAIQRFLQHHSACA